MYTNYIDPTISGFKANLYGAIPQTSWTGQNTVGFKPSWFGGVESFTAPFTQGLNTYLPYQGYVNPLAMQTPAGLGIHGYGLQGLNPFVQRHPFLPALGGLNVGPFDPRIIPGIQQGFAQGLGLGDIHPLVLQQYLAQQEILRCQALGCVPGVSPFGLGPQTVRVI